MARASCHADFLFGVGTVGILVIGLYDLDSKNEKAPGYVALVILFGGCICGGPTMRLDYQSLFGQQDNEKCQAQPPLFSCNHGSVKRGALDLISKYKKSLIALMEQTATLTFWDTYCVTGEGLQALRLLFPFSVFMLRILSLSGLGPDNYVLPGD